MKKGIIIGMGILFVAAILVSGCSKPEEKKVEAPPVMKETVQEKAAVVKEEMVEKAEPVVEESMKESASMTDQAVEVAKEMGEQAMESAVEKMPEEVQQAVDVAKQFSGDQMGQAATEEAAAAAETAPMVKDPSPSLEETMKDKAAEEAMKLPSKY